MSGYKPFWIRNVYLEVSFPSSGVSVIECMSELIYSVVTVCASANEALSSNPTAAEEQQQLPKSQTKTQPYALTNAKIQSLHHCAFFLDKDFQLILLS